jgi:hypothetical protein
MVDERKKIKIPTEFIDIVVETRRSRMSFDILEILYSKSGLQFNELLREVCKRYKYKLDYNGFINSFKRLSSIGAIEPKTKSTLVYHISPYAREAIKFNYLANRWVLEPLIEEVRSLVKEEEAAKIVKELKKEYIHIIEQAKNKYIYTS